VVARMERRVRPLLPSSESRCDQGHSEESREAGSEEQLLKEVRQSHKARLSWGMILKFSDANSVWLLLRIGRLRIRRPMPESSARRECSERNSNLPASVLP
jgi:hypothetical protein